MKTDIEVIYVVFNDNYLGAERFNSLPIAIERYEKIKKIFFDETAIETIYKSKERSITNDSGDNLRLEFIYKTY